MLDLIRALQRLRQHVIAAAHIHLRGDSHPGFLGAVHFVRAAGFDLALKTLGFQRRGQRAQVVNRRFPAGNHHMTRRPALTLNSLNQQRRIGVAPGIRFYRFDQNIAQRRFPIGQLLPGMFGITPATTHRTSL